ncbi:Cell surface hydrolase membrane-bound [Furfurilactobacillus rossiae]|uniref:alpha/beta hydrolase n=1 Tax=Furfurilactobacillus rossiae TaxID=231049 RepID=UPI0015C0B82E|nr:alpha/beta hydrolase [Furfurilactobacillus rossiae]MCF6165747.1 alpha/beta hydrolase [Furfurilactobacillus rossiae]QLE63129.1 Cell surface hydrolase membrane-bound [Furfurilactobacillus rossiae]
MKRHTKVLLIISLLLLGFVGWDAGHSLLYQHRLLTLHARQTHTATVFIGGYGSNAKAFDQMTTHWQRARIASHRELVRINHRGQLSFSGDRRPSTNYLVQLAFADNRDPAAQIRLLPKIMHELRTRQHITEVNFVTHSMGGGVAYSYLVTNHHDAQPQVRHWVAIASPFATINSNTSIAHRYNRYLKRAADLPRNLKILAIGGNVWGLGTDTEVSVAGVKALRPLAAQYVQTYQQHIINGDILSVQHSALRSNPEVIWQTAQFLF